MNSCAGLTYSNIFPPIKNYIFPADIEVDAEFISQRDYSFAKVRLGRTGFAIMPLAYIDNGVYEWVSNSGERIFTLNGKIVKTIGLPHNIDIINPILTNISFQDGHLSSNYLVKLSNPSAMIEQNSIFREFHGSDFNFIEVVTSNGFRWNYKNFYKVDPTGRLISTRQKIHPNLNLIEMNFYLK